MMEDEYRNLSAWLTERGFPEFREDGSRRGLKFRVAAFAARRVSDHNRKLRKKLADAVAGLINNDSEFGNTAMLGD
jgi:hypothetical protein